MSNSHLTALGLPVDSRVARNNAIAPGTAAGFSLPTEAPVPDAAAAADSARGSAQQPGALVGNQPVARASAPASGSETQTLGQRYDVEFEKRRAGFDSLYNSYFPA